ncbi:hypothetical protein CIB93_19590 [Streptomyces sp. WZ.A104]|uniref:Uncharacterized protein n=1 Tax=Streptomyces durocortorensis TaxID=2811104 RepID=A0ABY9W0K6_9ACTN|nr:MULTISPECIES: hypothetical protein [Streptomyces]PCG84438.1 hypothetical protein CIB93_19590 [Streptomyces sp. WZ.A104]WNF29681.1 hypothetical protein RI138_24205 [Streptomyces durocortorensis]
MRLRSTLAASLGALALIVTVPNSAWAANGYFGYSYTGADGQRQIGQLIDPPSRECVNLPEVSDPAASEPAHSPRNFTDATAVLFTDADCEGDHFALRPGGRASERLKLRSVVFS